MRTARRIALLLGVALASRGFAFAAEEADSTVPKGVVEMYQKLSRSIREAKLPDFMPVFHRDFIYEAPDGASLDRGPWRRKWLDLFDVVRFDRITFEPTEVVSREEDQVVVRTRCVVASTELETGVTRAREIQYEDTWTAADGAWTLIFRLEGEVGVEGTLSAATGEVASPRIAALAARLAAGDAESLTAFWSDLEENGTPIVEPIAGSQDVLVTFVWRGSGSEGSVRLDGGIPGRERLKPLARLRDTNLWYRCERLPQTARFTYSYRLEKKLGVPAFDGQPATVLLVGSSSVDPLGSRELDDLSLVELAGAPPSGFVNPDEDPAEGEIERHTLRSEALGERRFVSVYTPPGYDADGAAYPAVFLLDGGTYASRRQTRVVLDHLVAAKRVPPLVAFLVHSEGSRRQELEVSKEFLAFVGQELVAWARAEFPVRQDARSCVIGGNRLGSALAATCAVSRPDVFGSVLSEGGDLSVGSDSSAGLGRAGPAGGQTVASRLSASPKLPLRFRLTVGVLDGDAVVASNRHLRDVLRAKGYECEYSEVVANHNSVVWFDAMAQGLEALLAR